MSSKYLDRELNPAAREFYRRLAEDGQIATTRCDRCERASFPPLEHCPGCGEPTEWIELPRSGRLYAFTTQETALRFRAPVVLALVELGEVTVPAIAELPYNELRIGQGVSLEPAPEPETGLTVLRAVSGRSASRR